ncbi:hypothetical protein GLOTRDRAFT_141559, partial [Gloeophyllum trabeum ATCC 11539]
PSSCPCLSIVRAHAVSFPARPRSSKSALSHVHDHADSGAQPREHEPRHGTAQTARKHRQAKSQPPIKAAPDAPAVRPPQGRARLATPEPERGREPLLPPLAPPPAVLRLPRPRARGQERCCQCQCQHECECECQHERECECPLELELEHEPGCEYGYAPRPRSHPAPRAHHHHPQLRPSAPPEPEPEPAAQSRPAIAPGPGPGPGPKPNPDPNPSPAAPPTHELPRGPRRSRPPRRAGRRAPPRALSPHAHLRLLLAGAHPVLPLPPREQGRRVLSRPCGREHRGASAVRGHDGPVHTALAVQLRV